VWFWPGRHYNVFINYHDNGTVDNFYCNVSMPPHVEADVIRWVDLDLDVKVFADGTARILDEDEFILHSTLYAYPDDVQREARAAVDQILDMARQRIGPFHLLRHDVTVVP
jgi:hypothetical protein